MAGLDPFGRVTVLEDLFNAGAGNHVSLLETLPINGVGAVEVSPGGYARQPATVWTTGSLNGDLPVTTLFVNEIITFGPYGSSITFEGWAIYDALTSGNLLATGILRDSDLEPAGAILLTPDDDGYKYEAGDLSVSLTQDCPIVIGGLGLCPLIAGALIELPTTEIIQVPVGGPPVEATGGTVGIIGVASLNQAFDDSLFTAEVLFDDAVQAIVPFPIPVGPAPFVGWAFVFTQPVGSGVVVSFRVTKDADASCTFTQPYTITA